MATTAYPVNHPLAVKLWSKRLMREALKETYVSRFMGTTKDSLLYVKDEMAKSAGDRVRVGLRMQLTGAGVLGDGTLEGNEEALTTFTDDLLIDQLRHAVRSDGEMSEQRIPFSVREEGLDGLRDWWADRIDTSFFNQVCGNISVSETFAGLNSPIGPSGVGGVAKSVRQLFGSGSTSTTASLTATDSAGVVSRGLNFNVKVIDNAINHAKVSVPLIRPLRISGQYKYVMFIHPNQTKQLRIDNSANVVTWYDIMRARIQGGEMDTNPI